MSPAAGVEPGLFGGSRGCGGPSGLGCTAGLHRGCARGVGQRAPVCRCAASLALQARDRASLEAVVGATLGDGPLDTTPWPTTTKTRFANLKNSEPAPLSPIRASSARKSTRTATWEASFIKTTTCAAALKPRAAVAQALNTASTRAAQHKHSSRRAHQSMPLLRSWSLWRSILPILAGPAFCLLTVEAFRGDGRGPKSPDRGEQGGGFGEARREEEA